MSSQQPPEADDGANLAPREPPVGDPPLARGLEALLFLADEPLDVAGLALVLEVDPERVEAALEDLARRSVDEQRGVEVRGVAGGWRMYTAPAARPVIERWALAGRTGRVTQAALETLAVIAYKQPIGRAEIGEIRGVNADGAVRSLVARGFVTEVGRDPGPGQAALFGTTRLLLERLGLDSLDELPPLTDFLPEAPAPDEPALGALKEIRRRLAAGGELASRGPRAGGGAGGGADAGGGDGPGGASGELTGELGGRSAAETNTGAEGDRDDEDADVLPPPVAAVGGHRDDEQMDVLTQRLEQAARNAVGRLRAAVAAGDGRPADPDDALLAPEVPGAPGAPEAHEAPGAPEAHDAPGAPDAPDERRDETDG